jgi:hypothetical protein
MKPLPRKDFIRRRRICETGIEPQASAEYHDWQPACKASLQGLEATGSIGQTARTFDED